MHQILSTKSISLEKAQRKKHFHSPHAARLYSASGVCRGSFRSTSYSSELYKGMYSYVCLSALPFIGAYWCVCVLCRKNALSFNLQMHRNAFQGPSIRWGSLQGSPDLAVLKDKDRVGRRRERKGREDGIKVLVLNKC